MTNVEREREIERLRDKRKKLEDIKSRATAFEHWQKLAGDNVAESHIPDILWLIDHLDAAWEMEADKKRLCNESKR